jgi:flagellar motility protein MotE (MotC chaperone)
MGNIINLEKRLEERRRAQLEAATEKKLRAYINIIENINSIKDETVRNIFMEEVVKAFFRKLPDEKVEKLIETYRIRKAQKRKRP